MDIRLARSLSGSRGVSHDASESTVKISNAASEDNATWTRGTVIGGSGNDDEISTTVDLLVDSGTAIGGQGNEDAIPTTDDVTTDSTARDDG